ncbi:hypothetical protein [Bacillus sp. FJAT-45350]|uniref:hypothetical protein n=1 Tax=Bacillus sp. FJAT-45350 TaxID=2011014 RepID=UPI000BB70FAF|nr:hypothetical protein [Bacillus sp. FJAT-45350]
MTKKYTEKLNLYQPNPVTEKDDTFNIDTILNENWEKVDNFADEITTKKINAGNGLTGGGDLSQDRTVTLGTPSTVTATTSNSTTGTSHTHNIDVATQAEAETGSNSTKLMTPQRTKQAIDNIQAVKTVAGRTGNVTVTKEDVGLGNVDNVQQATKTEFVELSNDVAAHKEDYEQELKEDAIKPLVINTGTQIIESVKRSPLTVNRIDGKTVVNLIPPFTSREWAKHANATVSADGRTLTLVVSDSTNTSNGYWLSVKPNTSYIISGHTNNNNALIGVFDDAGGFARITNGGYISGENGKRIITTGDISRIRITTQNNGLANGTFTFSDLMLTEGTEQHDFVQGVQHTTGVYVTNETNDTYQYFARDSKGDVLRLADGEYIENGRKWKEIERIELDGSEDWKLPQKFTGYTIVRIDLPNAIDYEGTVVKYDGKVIDSFLSSSDSWNSDKARVTGGVFYLAISNTDSGWGDNYTPTADEIKAYFMRWRMYTDGQSNGGTYNGTGNKAWYPLAILGDAWNSSARRTVVPIEPYEVKTDKWKPYQLHYKLATPYWEEITTEGQVVLEEGENHVTLGSGMVVREVMASFEGTTTLATNTPIVPQTLYSYPTNKILEWYSNGKIDNNVWEIVADSNAYGNERLIVYGKEKADKTAQYTVTYLALPHVITSGIASVQAEVYENIKSVQDKHTVDIADTTKRVNVLEMQTNPDLSMFASKKQEEWIEPVLMNGWAQSNRKLAYFKDNFGLVHLRGEIRDGSTGHNTILFMLPKGYRPNIDNDITISTHGGLINGVSVMQLRIKSNGEVNIQLNDAKTFIQINGISFRAEQ